jgi:hypothetical protein
MIVQHFWIASRVPHSFLAVRFGLVSAASTAWRPHSRTVPVLPRPDPRPPGCVGPAAQRAPLLATIAAVVLVIIVAGHANTCA